MNGQEKSYTKLDGLLRNIASKIEVDSPSTVVQISRYAEDWEDIAEDIKKLQSDNSVLRTNVDGLEVKNVNLQAKVDGLEIKIDRQQREIDRLRSRDGHATIELCFGDGNHPFAREKLKVCDFGVSDNCYVVESQEIDANLKRIKELEHNLSAKESQCDLYSQEIDANLKRIKELEAKNAEYLVDIMALKCVSSQMRCAYCNHEMIDANPGDGGVYIKKLVIEHMDKCEKHPLFEARKRIKELEAEVAAVKGKVKDALGMLVAYTGEFPEVLSVAEKDLNNAISTPTGSKLLAKIEAGEKLVSIVKKVTCLAYAPCGEDHVELVVSANKALSAYRAACAGGGE